jgi:signal recognition particle subunit SRP72
VNELERLEKNVGLSKQRTKSGELTDPVEKKIKKKKKRKHPRYYPKGFDKSNPGPKPNDERWLPKFERKDYKKRKGA